MPWHKCTGQKTTCWHTGVGDGVGWGLFHHVGHGLGSKHLHWMSHLADPLSHFYKALVAPHLYHLFTHKRGPPAVSFNPFIAYR